MLSSSDSTVLYEYSIVLSVQYPPRYCPERTIPTLLYTSTVETQPTPSVERSPFRPPLQIKPTFRMAHYVIDIALRERTGATGSEKIPSSPGSCSPSTSRATNVRSTFQQYRTFLLHRWQPRFVLLHIQNCLYRPVIFLLQRHLRL